MKILSYKGWGNVLAAIFLAASLLFSAVPQAAQAQEPALPTEQAYLIPIPLPDLRTAELPTRLERDQVESVTEGLLAKEAGKILDELRRLKDRGVVSKYEVLPDAPVIRVTLTQENVPDVMQSLPGEAKGLVEESEGLPACISTAVEHFPDVVLAASRQKDWRESEELARAQVLAAGAPVIQVYFYESTDYSYGEVWGTAAPKSEVQFRLLRNGQQVALDYEWTDDGGYFNFWPKYYSCMQSDNWALQAGDVVEISASGFTSSTVVTPIRGWLDAETNTAMGFTTANRIVKVELYQMNRAAPCDTQTFTQTGTSDGAGNFSINLGGTVNFDRSAYAQIYSIDAAGNSTYSYADTYRLMVYPYGDYYLYLKPQTSFTVVLKRGTTIVETVSGVTDPDWGGYSNYFTQAVQPGDQAMLTFNGGQLTYTVVDFPDISVNRATGQVNGSAAAGLILEARILNHANSVSPRCSYAGKCSGQTVPANGQFSFNLGTILNGEDFYINFFTPEGEALGDSSFEPSIEAMPDEDAVAISWWFTQDLTVTLKDNANAVKETYTFSNSYWNSWFWFYFSADMVPGDRIEVTDGYNTRSMTVGDVANVRANYNTDRVTGTASAGHLLAEAYSNSYGCAEKDHAGGAFDLFPGVDILGGVGGKVTLRGADGYYTQAYGGSLMLRVTVNDVYVSGYTETPNTTVVWTHKRGITVLGTNAVSSNASRYFYFFTDVPPQSGDVLLINTGDGNNATITFPELTVQLVPPERRAFGKAPANQSVNVILWRATADGAFGRGYYGMADGAGNYSIHFPIDFWWFNCTPIDLNGACQFSTVNALMENGFRIESDFPWPGPAAPDAYEADNTWQTAQSYTAPQAHTLDSYQDEDWVKFTVSAADVAEAAPFHLLTLDVGLEMDLNLELYAATNLTTPIATAWGEYDPVWNNTQPPSLVYTFSQAGTYYLRIHSKGDDWDGGSCVSKYTLVILRDPQNVFLPLVQR